MLGRREGMATVMATVPTAPIVAPGVMSGMEHMPKMGYMRPRPSAASSFDLEASFSEIIGLEPIKDKIRALRDTLVKRRFRLEVGAPLVDVGPLHMVFTGNPGCGKTSIARLVARLLHELGAVRRPAFVEVQRTDLVASHIGQTGPKTREKINEAAGGVLFIDEAYGMTPTVVGSGYGGYEKAIIDTLVVKMTEHPFKGQMVVILAGASSPPFPFLLPGSIPHPPPRYVPIPLLAPSPSPSSRRPARVSRTTSHSMSGNA
jgi:hypothetical protein